MITKGATPTPTGAGNGGGDRPPLRHLDAQTIITLGHVGEADLDLGGARDAKYNQPLWKRLCSACTEQEVEVASYTIDPGVRAAY